MKAQSTNGVRWKIRTKHREGEDAPFHEWWWTGEPVKADSLGRRNPRMYGAHWASVRCIYADCPGEALIRIQDMVELLPTITVKPRKSSPSPDRTIDN
ncbi:hypothetical protein SEA_DANIELLEIGNACE_42 [Arthrobacter phage DanielleIgnace]|nr:hypothetical protein SEA_DANIELLEIGNACE_42 [Arthrobacter phage DanielleIgnace]